MYWKSQSWLFHIRLKVVQCIMEPMILYHNLATPKCLGGISILNLSKHMMARRFLLLQDMCSKSQPWPFHVRLKVVQCIMEPMILYYLPLLPWTKKALHSILQPLRYLLWKKRDKMGITWVAWNHLATPKRLGGTGILNLSKHMMARRFSLLQDMCSESQPWISIAQYFIENKGFTHGRTKIEASWWQLLNGCISLKISGSTCVQHLATSWQEALSLCVWKPSSSREHCNSLHKELLVSYAGQERRDCGLILIVSFVWGSNR